MSENTSAANNAVNENNAVGNEGVKDNSLIGNANEGTKGQTGDNTGNEPVAYEFKLPEGFTVPEGSIEKLSELLNKSKVAKEDAQGIVDFYLGLQGAETQKVEAELKAYQDSLVAQVKADPEIGGAKLTESLALAKKAVVKFGGEDLLQYLDDTKLGNDPRIIKAFYKVGKAISEGSFVEGGVPKTDGIKRTETGAPILNFDK